MTDSPTLQERFDAALAALPPKQRLFVEEYLACLNAAEAARRAGYSVKTARSQGQRLLTYADIAAAIQAGLALRAMPADEVLARLADMARADIRDLFNFDDAGEMTGLRLTRDAPLHLIKSVTPTRYGTKIEVHDQQAALALLGKHHGLFVDRQETGPPGAFAPVREVVIEVPADESVDTNE